MSEQEEREKDMLYDNDSSLAFQEPSGDALVELDHRFPPGQHPLEGLHNAYDLPPPEPLNSSSEEVSKTLGIPALLGEYRTMSLFSKHWALREAALNKTS